MSVETAFTANPRFGLSQLICLNLGAGKSTVYFSMMNISTFEYDYTSNPHKLKAKSVDGQTFEVEGPAADTLVADMLNASTVVRADGSVPPTVVNVNLTHPIHPPT